MKPIINRLSRYTTIVFFPILLFMRPGRRWVFLSLLGMLVLAGCFQKFYQTGTVNTIDAASIEQLKNSQKYFIIHYTDAAYRLQDFSILNDRMVGKRSALPEEHSRSLNPKQDAGNVLRPKYHDAVLSEVHLYVNRLSSADPESQVNVGLSDLYRMDAYEFDAKSTKSSTIASIVGISAVIAILGFVLAMSVPDFSTGTSTSTNTNTTNGECNCPKVYVEHKGNFDFQSGIFSGAVYSNLERMDHLPLGITSENQGSVHLKITGHDKERQFLNVVQLSGVPYREGQQILVDRKGVFHALNDLQVPIEATGNGGASIYESVLKADQNTYAFDGFTNGRDFSDAYLTFNNPDKLQSGSLVIRAKNTGWAARLNQEYSLLFGEDYTRYRDHIEKKKNAHLDRYLLDQGLPLKLYVEKEGTWEFVDYFPLNGTEQYRDMVIPITFPATEKVRVKLVSVYRFWEVDYAAIDFTAEPVSAAFTLSPERAHHNLQGDQIAALAGSDRSYAVLEQNESIDLTFAISEKFSGSKISYFLTAGGYYHDQHPYPVKANISKLKEFEQPAAFDRFSREKFHEWKYMEALVGRSMRE